MSQTTESSHEQSPSDVSSHGGTAALSSSSDHTSAVSREAAAIAIAQTQKSRASGDSASLDKIREILFGSQVRTHEQHFQDLEHQLDSLKTEVQERFERLDDLVSKRFDTLTQQIQTEREARQQGLSRAGDVSRDLEKGLDQKLTKMEKKLDTETQALLQEILDQSSQLTEAMHEKSEELMGELEREVKKRRSQHQGERANLSALFGELSARLRDEN